MSSLPNHSDKAFEEVARDVIHHFVRTTKNRSETGYFAIYEEDLNEAVKRLLEAVKAAEVALLEKLKNKSISTMADWRVVPEHTYIVEIAEIDAELAKRKTP